MKMLNEKFKTKTMEDFEELHQIEHSEELTRSYLTRYIAEVRHLGLGTYRVFKDMDEYILDNKIEAQFVKWDEQWSKTVHKNKILDHKEANLNIAEERTREAKTILQEVENILMHTLSVDDTIDWDTLKDKKKFKIPNPKNQLDKELSKILPIGKSTTREHPSKPNPFIYQPKLSLVDKIFKSMGQKKIDQATALYNIAVSEWEQAVKEVDNYNQSMQVDFDEKSKERETQIQALRLRYNKMEAEWKIQEEQYYSTQNEHNQKVALLKEAYLSGDTESVVQYCELVLNNSQYPECFSKDFEIEYINESKMLIVEYVLPTLESMPSLTEVKYVATKKELKESYLSEVQLAKNYDETVYKIVLRTLHELFEADQAKAIDIIVFNGWVNAIDKSTGKRTNNCIVSIQVKKEEFLEIELEHVEPKTCFKKLKGIGSSKLSGITAIQPILQINRNDKRFIASYEVASKLNEGENLAAMDWSDFEHLLREIFAKEFSANGGEVKVTQASRDGGVDAIAFDPDPIRGGKIVIQAKRYTNTVGVSAVRDLYGTVMNEGASKGILVTTSDYGPDAYEFVKNKPITLMNGANLLYLLEKHGHKAKIDLAEAKRILK
jgi:restriction system protein